MTLLVGRNQQQQLQLDLISGPHTVYTRKIYWFLSVLPSVPYTDGYSDVFPNLSPFTDYVKWKNIDIDNEGQEW